MAKSKVTPLRPAEQPAPDAPRTVPLSEITITWPRRNDFEGDEQRPPVVLSGKHLGQHLEWIARMMPARVDLTAREDVFLDGLVYLRLEGVSEILRMLGSADHGETDFRAVLALLADSTQSAVAELAANGGAYRIGAATVTIGAPAEGAR